LREFWTSFTSHTASPSSKLLYLLIFFFDDLSFPHPLIQQYSHIHPVVQRHQPVLQPVRLDHLLVELAHGLDVVVLLVLGGREDLLARGVGVVLAVVGDEAATEDVVGDDEAALFEEARG
jgi:hypothetical protein